MLRSFFVKNLVLIMGYKVFDILNCSKEKCQELYFIREKIEKFVKEMCESYLDECRQENERKTLEKMTAVKSFYDSVWGSIEVEERDIYLIDCPLIQRLRDIKQLGMVNYLYSTANHTRFSHTLGVMKIAGDLVEKVMKECSTKSTLKSHYEGDDIFRCVRIAALFFMMLVICFLAMHQKGILANIEIVLFVKNSKKFRVQFEKKSVRQ